MKRKHKIYSRPKRPFEKKRIEEESQIKKEFGLKNKKEIWRAEAKIKEIREKAKKLISANPNLQKEFFERLQKDGFKVNSIADVLSLEKRDYLKRRLQTLLAEKGFAKTAKEARQLIIHRKVLVGKNSVDSPSHLVPVSLEDKINLKEKKDKLRKEETEKKEGAPEKEKKNAEEKRENNAEKVNSEEKKE